MDVDEESDIEDRVDSIYADLKAKGLAQQRIWNEGAEEALMKLPEPVTPGELEVLSKDIPRQRINGLLPEQGNLTMVAENKCGKTERTMELCRSLLTGESYLGRFEVVDKLDGNVLYLNYEVSSAMFYDWMAAMGLDKPTVGEGMMLSQHLRDYRNVPILSDAGAEWLVNLCKNNDAKVLVVDTAGRAMTAAGYDEENSNDGIKVFTSRLDAIKAEAGVQHLIIPIHAIRAVLPVRPRGADAWGGWHDVQISMRRKDARKLESPRLFSASGRDVEVPETLLEYDADTRTCTLAEPKSGAPTEEDLDGVDTRPRRKRGRQEVSDDEIYRRVEVFMTSYPDATEAQCERGVTGAAKRVRDAYKLYTQARR
ncbi:AAA family ATPase [Mycobacteroides abscessus]|uniref:AAA family ATPase n=1 Tax=Mycobacteroides abscessus TaxID=36809 RepID=UPI000C26498C|nr:AAA family ATPase [Mycobacteroides abscessus]